MEITNLKNNDILYCDFLGSPVEYMHVIEFNNTFWLHSPFGGNEIAKVGDKNSFIETIKETLKTKKLYTITPRTGAFEEVTDKEKTKLSSDCEGTLVGIGESTFFIVQCEGGKFIMLEVYQEYCNSYRIRANREKDPMSLDELNSYLDEVDAKVVGKGLSVKL